MSTRRLNLRCRQSLGGDDGAVKWKAKVTETFWAAILKVWKVEESLISYRPKRMKGWVRLVSWPTVDGLPTNRKTNGTERPTHADRRRQVKWNAHRSSSISRLDSLSDKWRQSCSRRSISICSLRWSRTFSSRICRSSSANCAIFSLSEQQNNKLCMVIRTLWSQQPEQSATVPVASLSQDRQHGTS